MYIRCWGSRGSIPVSGREYIKYGGDTTCMEIRPESGEIIIVDAGTGIRRLGNHLVNEKRHEYHMIFTHVHWDHIMGYPFFRPIYSPKTRLHLYRPPNARFIETMLNYMMMPPYFPVPYGQTACKVTYADPPATDFTIGSMKITPVPLSHPNTGRGYKFTEKGKHFVFLTDNELHHPHPGGLSYQEYVEFCKGADFLVHDADYTPTEYQTVKSWGHSTYIHAVRLGLDAGVKKLGLFHLNQNRTDDEVDRIVDECRELVVRHQGDMECFAVGSDMVVTV